MALQIFGTDFSMIEKVFNGERSREQIKNKFRKEEKKNKSHIDNLLKNKAGVSLKQFIEKYGPLKDPQKDKKKDEGNDSSSLGSYKGSSESSSNDDDDDSGYMSSSSSESSSSASENKGKLKGLIKKIGSSSAPPKFNVPIRNATG